jgi:protein SCO1
MKNEERKMKNDACVSRPRGALRARNASSCFCFSFFVFRFSFFILFLCLCTSANAASRLPVIQPAPKFDLIDQTGKPARLSDFKDKVLLVSFIFTTCSGSCPATTHRMAKIQEELQGRHLVEKGVHLLSISLDPVRDTPERLAGYMRLYDVDAKSWTFLTGPSETVAKTIAAWGIWARPAANGQLDHPSRVFLVDRRGRIREIYNLDFLRVPWVIEDVELLLREK